MKQSFIALLTLCVAFAFSATSIADDASELTELRNEVKALRSEIAALRKERDELKSQLTKGATNSSPRLEGELNGIQWEITALNKEGVAIGSTKFYAQDGKIYKDGVELGTYVDAGNNARMDVTKSPLDKFNGTYSLMRVKNDPPTYTGTFKNKLGAEVKVLLKALID